MRLVPARIPGSGDKIQHAIFPKQTCHFDLHLESIITWSFGVRFSLFDLLYYLESAPKNIWAEEGRCEWKFKKLHEGEHRDLKVSPAYF